jgi:hypothetical protein
MEIRNCILVSLSISHWDANSLDKLVSEAVATESGVKDQRMCRLRKSLLPKTRVMDQLSSVIRAARKFHYDNTHAWVHEGPRILTRANYDMYMRDMLRNQSEFKTCVLDFCAQYTDIKVAAEDALGKLYRESDYPGVETLASRYNFTIDPLPMPSATTLIDFGLDESETATLRAKLEDNMSSTFIKANKKMWEDLYGKLEKLTNKVNEEGAHVMDETIDGVKRLADLIPRINLLADERLDVVAKHIGAFLEGVTSKGIKVNPSLRDRVAKESKAALAAMQVMMREESKSVATLAPAAERLALM